MNKTILIMGAPGTGKGTFSQLLQENLAICHIATGNIFRENIKNKTAVGIKVLKYIEQGSLVPDEITDEMILQRLQQKDVQNKMILLDGYPRNLHQAHKLIQFLAQIGKQIDLVLWLNSDEKIIINRISNRRLCKECGQVYNVKTVHEQVKGRCDKCNGELYQRQDDNASFALSRLKEYKKLTLPLIDFLKNKTKLLKIDTSSGNIELNYQIIFKAVKD